MEIPSEHIEGENKGDVRFYGLSTCIWREDAPGVCPICKAKQDKLERFM